MHALHSRSLVNINRLGRKRIRLRTILHFFSTWKRYVQQKKCCQKQLNFWHNIVTRKKKINAIILRKQQRCMFRIFFRWDFGLSRYRKAKIIWKNITQDVMVDFKRKACIYSVISNNAEAALGEMYFNSWYTLKESSKQKARNVHVKRLYMCTFSTWINIVRWSRVLAKVPYLHILYSTDMFKLLKREKTFCKLRKHQVQKNVISRIRRYLHICKGYRRLYTICKKFQQSRVFPIWAHTVRVLRCRRRPTQNILSCVFQSFLARSNYRKITKRFSTMYNTMLKRKMLDTLAFAVVSKHFGHVSWMISFEMRRQRNIIRVIGKLCEKRMFSKNWFADYVKSSQRVIMEYEEGILKSEFNVVKIIDLITAVPTLPKRWKSIVKSTVSGVTSIRVTLSITCCIHGNVRLQHFLRKEWEIFNALKTWRKECTPRWRNSVHASSGMGKPAIGMDLNNIPPCLYPGAVDHYESLERWKLFMNCVYSEMIYPTPSNDEIYGTLEVITTEVCGMTDEMALPISTPMFCVTKVESAVNKALSCLHSYHFRVLGDDSLRTCHAMNRLNLGMTLAMQRLSVSRGMRLGCEYVTTRHRMYIETICTNKNTLKAMAPITEDTVAAVSDATDMCCSVCYLKYDMRNLAKCPILAIDNYPICLECTENEDRIHHISVNTVMKNNPPCSLPTSKDLALLSSLVAGCLTDD